MPGLQTAFAQGLAANRPAAASSNSGYYWLSTDVNGGTLYQSTGSAWVQLAAGVSQAGFADPTTTKGDLIVHGTTTGRLGVGTDTFVLTADSTQTLGVKWAAGGGAGALTQIAQTILSSTTASITFSSIAGTYSALLVIWLARASDAVTQEQVLLQLNSDTAANYDHERFMGYSTTNQSAQSTAQTSGEVGQTTGSSGSAGLFTCGQILLPAYASTTPLKVALCTGTHANGATTDPRTTQNTIFWRSTAAITSIKLFAQSGSFVAGTSVTLYALS